MSVLVLKENRFDYFLRNISSENLGFYFSFFLHFIIMIFIFGLPNIFEPAPVTVPNIIPIEIVNVTDITSLPKKIEEKKENIISESVVETKKFNSANTQEIKKIELKKKPEVKLKESEIVKTPKNDIILKEKEKSPIKLEKEKEVVINEKIEALPTAKIKPKIKPKPMPMTNVETNKSDVMTEAKPKPKPEPEFNIASMLKDLRNEKSTQVIEKDNNEKKKEINSDQKKSNDSENFQLSISEIDVLRQQLTSCWIAPAGAVIEKGMIVKISAKVKQNRRIFDNSVRIVDTNISKNNTFYGPITESAMRTLLNPDCIPLKLPSGKYNLWKNLTITFDYSIMKGYD